MPEFDPKKTSEIPALDTAQAYVDAFLASEPLQFHTSSEESAYTLVHAGYETDHNGKIVATRQELRPPQELSFSIAAVRRMYGSEEVFCEAMRPRLIEAAVGVLREEGQDQAIRLRGLVETRLAGVLIEGMKEAQTMPEPGSPARQ